MCRLRWGRGTFDELQWGVQTSRVGPVAVSFTGHPQAALSNSSGQVTAVGQAGAVYSSLSMNPAANLASTFLVFARSASVGGDQMYTVPATGVAAPTLLVHGSINGYPSISQSGVIAFASSVSNTYSIDTIKSDGSGQKIIATPGVAAPTISPNGTTIAYGAGNGDIYSEPIGGGFYRRCYME